MWRLLGAKPKAISVMETLAALQANVVEAYDQSPVYAFATSWYHSANHVSMSRHFYQVGILAFCKDALKGVPAATRRAILVGAAEETIDTTEEVRRLTGDVMEQFRKEGIQIVELTPQERALLRERTRPAYETFRKGMSSAGRELLSVIEAKLRDLRRGRLRR
jgi:TRAP-type C4-dicarboxylate transport system substrate-binding protein